MRLSSFPRISDTIVWVGVFSYQRTLHAELVSQFIDNSGRRQESESYVLL